MAIADLKHNSPTNQQSQNVNIVVNPTYTDKKVAYPNVDNALDDNPQTNIGTTDSAQNPANPYSGLPPDQRIITRDIETAMKKTGEISESIEEKENTIKALTLIIEIIQSNPLIVNKYVVAEADTLQELLKLLTNAENVEIDTDDIECSCSKAKYRIVRRIYIKKDGEVYGIAQCPVILRLFDLYKISLSLVI